LGSGNDEYLYKELSALIGSDVQNQARGYLMTAREIVRKEKGYVFRPLRNLGLRRLTQEEVARLRDRSEHIRRTAKKWTGELGTVDLLAVSEQARVAAVAGKTLARLTALAHEPKRVKQLEESIGKKFKPDLSKMLDSLKEAAE
jgi:hypothetical protein